MKLFITGAAGYIGGMLAERFAQRDDVDEVICLDKNPITQELKSLPKVLYLRANTADDTWQDIVVDRKPNIVIHCAWQIREFYFRKKLQERWNINGSRNVFEFALKVRHSEAQPRNPDESEATGSLTEFTPAEAGARDDSPCHLIHFSSVAVYGAYPGNRIDHPFTESDPMREHEYRYGVEKRQSEEMLCEMSSRAKSMSSRAEPRDPEGVDTDITVLRIASLTGPRYKAVKRGFTLQNILALLPVIPIANPEWGRQFVQEEELVSIINQLCHSGQMKRHPERSEAQSRDPVVSTDNGIPRYAQNDVYYRILNIAPSPFIKAAEIVRMYGKKMLPVPKEFMRLVFFILRHASLGRLPTSRGGWRFYVYPVAVDGSASLKKFLVDHVA